METAAVKMTRALLEVYHQTIQKNLPAEGMGRFEDLYLSPEPFLQKIKALDDLMTGNGIADDTGELLFDILLFNFFSEDSQRLGEGFFDSREWEKIEEGMMDRGTELLNLLLYLQECEDSGIRFSLDDYLDEYLITEDDLDHEEYDAYEAILKNRDVIEEADAEALAEIDAQNRESRLGEQLLPILLFFEPHSAIEEKYDIIAKRGSNPPFQSAFLAALTGFTNDHNK